MIRLRALLLVWPFTILGVAALKPPANLTLSSVNFQHILTWEEPNNASLIYYKVEYKKLMGSLTMVSRDCSDITVCRCDLTKDLTDVLSDYTVWVTSYSEGEASPPAYYKRFCPVEDTILGPALVEVVACDYCIKVLVEPPVSYLWSEQEQRNVSMLSSDVYPMLTYHIQLNRSGEVQKNDVQSDLENITFPNLLPRTNYCVSVTKVTTSLNHKDHLSIPSAVKCVITGPRAIRLDIIIPVVVGVLLLLAIVGVLITLDRAGFIGMRRKFFPKVLKSFPRSESVFSGCSECPSPAYILPVEVISQKVEVEKRQEGEDKRCEEGYASRKKLLDSDTSGGDSSGPNTSSHISSMESSGQATSSSGEERIPRDQSAGMDIMSGLDDSWCSGAQLPAVALVPSSTLPLNTNEVFNVNLNSISIANTEDVWTGFTQSLASLKEDPDPHINSGQGGNPLNGDLFMCSFNGLDIREPTVTDEEYGSSYEEEEEPTEDCDINDHSMSGYMRR